MKTIRVPYQKGKQSPSRKNPIEKTENTFLVDVISQNKELHPRFFASFSSSDFMFAFIALKENLPKKERKTQKR